MAKLFWLLITCVASFPFQNRIVFPNEKCLKPNEEFDECKSHCTETCLTVNDSTPCVPGCAIGCSCKDGYVRNFDNECVNKENCKNQKHIDDTENIPENWERNAKFT